MRTFLTRKMARPALWRASAAGTELVILAIGFLLLAPTRVFCTSVTCNQKRVKPLRHICGIVIDESGAPVPQARVTILKDGTELATLQTGTDGQFSFEGLKQGNYEFQAQKEGFHGFRIPVVLVKPRDQCKRALEVVLSVANPCPGARLVKPKIVERRLHPAG